MKGNVCIVTGATAGIGKHTAVELACKQATVVVVGRNKEKCDRTVAEIRDVSDNPKIDTLVADLSSQAQIRRIASEFREKYDRLDVLVNNAGAAFIQRQISIDGIEKTFALNHLNYFLLVNLLLDMLISSAPSRIVNVSSGNHFGQRLDFDNLQLNRGYNPLKAYGKTKLANVLFTYELDRRLAGTGVTANAINPGRVATDIWKNIGPVIGPLVAWVMTRNAQTPEEGAQGLIYLASSPEVAGVSGKYYRKKAEMKSDSVTYDQALAKRLWDCSEELTGLR